MTKKAYIFIGVLAVVIFIVIPAMNVERGGDFSQKRGGFKNREQEIYPRTGKAPVLELTWDGELDPDDVTRYTPYGIWEALMRTPKGIAYEPANEMQFYVKTDVKKLLAVAPGVVTQSDTFEGGAGLVTVRYGENYAVTYLHAIPDKDIQVGQKIEVGDMLGLMEKKINPHHGEETWWEISLTKNNDGVYRTVPPYDYFSDEGKVLLDAIAKASKETAHVDSSGKPIWTVRKGCSWIKYTGEPSWWDSNRFDLMEGKESQEEFIENLGLGWAVGDRQGRIIGPTDKCD